MIDKTKAKRNEITELPRKDVSCEDGSDRVTTKFSSKASKTYNHRVLQMHRAITIEARYHHDCGMNQIRAVCETT